MDIDYRRADAGQKAWGENLHVPGEDDEVGRSHEKVELGLLRLRLRLPRHRDVVVGNAERCDLALEIGVIGDHRADVHPKLAAAPPPQQIEQTVVVSRRENRNTLAFA